MLNDPSGEHRKLLIFTANKENNDTMRLKNFHKFISMILIFTIILSSCSIFHKEPDPSELYTPTPEPTATPLPDPRVMVTEVPDPILTAEAFLNAWKDENYVDMYNLLCTASRDSYSYDYFSDRYNSSAVSMTLNAITTEITEIVGGAAALEDE